MAIGRLTFVLLVQCIFLVNVYSDNDFRDNSDEYYRPQILFFVNSLNLNPNRDYNFNYATLISAQNKVNIFTVTFSVLCLQKICAEELRRTKSRIR